MKISHWDCFDDVPAENHVLYQQSSNWMVGSWLVKGQPRIGYITRLPLMFSSWLGKVHPPNNLGSTWRRRFFGPIYLHFSAVSLGRWKESCIYDTHSSCTVFKIFLPLTGVTHCTSDHELKELLLRQHWAHCSPWYNMPSSAVMTTRRVAMILERPAISR